MSARAICNAIAYNPNIAFFQNRATSAPKN